MKKIGFYAGSFDPFTKGHLAIVCEALCTFDKIIIGVGINPSKNTLFDKEERENLIAQSIDDLIQMYRYRALNKQSFTIGEKKAITRLMEEPECLQIVSYEGLTIDVAIRRGATSLIRGERIVGDHDAEMALSVMNRELLNVRGRHLDMASIPVPDTKLTYISSSVVKNLCSLGEYVAAQKYVMPSVHQALMKKFLHTYYPQIASQKGQVSWHKLCLNYSKRAYHNLSHIGYCLNYVNVFDRISQKERRAFTLLEQRHLYAAVFYHDYVCLGQDDDEVCSAKKARKYLSSLGNHSQDVEDMIMATKHTGDFSKTSLACQVMHDVDLAILGDRDNYGIYAMQIRKEYSSYETEIYAQNRCEVLRRLLDSDYLYQTGFFREIFEENAQQNMKVELAYWEELL